jgi:glycosyltransferase involved in cell wall biosynthesis
LVGLWNNEKRMEDKKLLSSCEIMGITHSRSLLKTIGLLARWLFEKKSFILGQYYNKSLLGKIKKIVKDNEIEFVFCSELSAMQYADFFISKKVPVYFDDHNVEHQLYNRMSKFTIFPLNYFLKREAGLIRIFEKKALKSAKHIFSVSDMDKNELNGLAIDKNKITVIENCFDDKKKVDVTLSRNPTIVFAGNLSWRPNEHGLKKFILEILPKIIVKIPNVEIYIIGSNLPRSIKKISEKMPVNFFINIGDEKKEEIINTSWVGIVPLYFASGTRIKIIEYWSHGKVVVSTDIGAEGLEKSEGTMIVKTNTEFIEKLVFLIRNKEEAIRLGGKNHLIFKDVYDSELVYKENIFKFFD